MVRHEAAATGTAAAEAALAQYLSDLEGGPSTGGSIPSTPAAAAETAADASHDPARFRAPLTGGDPVTTYPAVTYEQVFVILRVDTTTSRVGAPETAVAVLKALWSEAAAEAEVARLNQPNRERGYAYFWKSARVERRLAQTSAR